MSVGDQSIGGAGSPSGQTTMFMGRTPLGGLPDAVMGLIYSIRDIEVRIEEGAMTGDQVKEAVADLYPPSSLFSHEIRAFPVLYTHLRDFLNANGASLTPHRSRRIVMTLALGLYNDNEDTVAAEEIAKAIVSEGRSSGRAGIGAGPSAAGRVETTETFSAPSADHKTAHSIAMRFKDSSAKFSGDIGESWMEYVAEYQQVARDYNLSPSQKLQFLHNLVRGDAKRFYLNSVESHVNTFRQAVDMISMEYNSVVRQNRVKNYLNGLRLSTFLKQDMTPSEALERVYKLITKLAPQVPQSHRGDAHKIEFLRNAIVGENRATEPLSRIATHALSFQQLYGELEAALHLERESKLAIMRDSVTMGRSRSAIEDNRVPGVLHFNTDGANDADVFYQGQGMYARAHKRLGDKSKQPRPMKRFDPLMVMGCFNCDDPGHVIRNCPKKVDATRAAKKKIEYLEKKMGKRQSAHILLASLCLQLDAEQESDQDTRDIADETDIDITEDALFGAIVSYMESPDYLDAANKEVSINIVNSSQESHEVPIYNTSEHMADFHGACIDTGAQKSVVGRMQAESYYRWLGLPLLMMKSTNMVYKFGTYREPSIGTAKFKIPYADDREIVVELDVVNLNVPLLIGLDVLDKYKLFVDTVENKIVCKNPKWEAPLKRARGHVYYTWNIDIMYTEYQLRRIHRHFYHPQPERIFNIMKRADGSRATLETLSTLKKITRECDICQRVADQPGRFRVSLPEEDVVFNRTVMMDLMFLESQPVLHIICKDTLFSTAVLLTDGSTTKDVWRAYIRHWVNVYVGYSKIVHTDQGTQFVSDTWKSLLHSAGIKHHVSGIQSHNALGVGERYHAYLRRIFEKVRSEHPRMDQHDVLSISVHAMNTTAGPNGLIPTLLVFGCLPQLPSGFSDVPEQRERMKTMIQARNEMAVIIAKSRIQTALNKRVPRAADRVVDVGKEVLVYREKPENRWVGPFKVIAGKGKSVWINVKGKLRNVSIDKIKEYKRPSNNSLDIDSYHPAEPKSNMNDLTAMDNVFDRVIAGEVFLSKLHDAVTHLVKEVPESVSVNQPEIELLLTEVLKRDDSRCDSPDFHEARQKEINGLKSRDTWKTVKLSSLPEDANVIGGRFVLTLKRAGTPEKMAKARYVAQGFNDKMKPFIVHNNPTLRQTSTKIIVSVAAIRQFRLGLLDVTQAYLQAKDKFTREIYLKPKQEDRKYFKISNEEVLRLQKPLYGICDAGDYWGATFSEHVKNDLGMTPLDGDPSLYMKEGLWETEGVLGAYVDDCLFTGGSSFEESLAKIQQRFESKPISWDDVEFVGIYIKSVKHQDGTVELTISQKEYIVRLHEIPVDASYSMFESIRAAFAWISHSRPDQCCAINRAAQVTESTFELRHIKELNKAIRDSKRTADVILKYERLQHSTLHLRVYSDASFASNDDSSSQLGYIILLSDDYDRCHVLCYSSKKSRRKVRSIMGGEIYALSNAFDHAYVIRHDLERILGANIPIMLFTDSKQIFDVITRASHTTEKRLMIDIAATRESYNRFEISNVGLVTHSTNPADGLTKPAFCKALDNILRTGFDHTPVVQWIIRTVQPIAELPNDASNSD